MNKMRNADNEDKKDFSVQPEVEMRKTFSIFVISILGISILLLSTMAMAQQMPYTTTKTGDCGQNYGAPKGRVGFHRVADPQGGWQTKGFILDSFGPMPQTAYDPNFGCYPGNARTINRYPAFHGYYYDTPANYRHYAEYPWNADLAEPRPYPNNAVPQVGMKVQMVPGQQYIMEEAPLPPGVVTPVTPAAPADPAAITAPAAPEIPAVQEEAAPLDPSVLQ